MQLIYPCPEMLEQFLNLAHDYKASGENRYQNVLNPDFNFGRYLRSIEENRKGISLSTGRVPQSLFWLVDERMEILGASRLRHYLTPDLERTGGHIGYDVAPSYRRKGYGTILLSLTLEKARALGLNKVLVTCDADNVGSEKIILRNGGILENQTLDDDGITMVRRFWISL